MLFEIVCYHVHYRILFHTNVKHLVEFIISFLEHIFNIFKTFGRLKKKKNWPTKKYFIIIKVMVAKIDEVKIILIYKFYLT